MTKNYDKPKLRDKTLQHVMGYKCLGVLKVLMVESKGEEF